MIKKYFYYNQNWTFDNQLVRIAFKNHLVFNLWEPTLRELIENFFP